MKPSVLVWGMSKSQPKRTSFGRLGAFTLIEVMVSVLIISVVIMALLQMRGNSSHLFLSFSKKSEMNKYLSFLISNDDYGHDNKKTTLYKLLGDFDIEDNLKRELKSANVEIIYKELELIDMGGQEDEEVDSKVVFEIGKTILKTNDLSASVLRIKSQ